MLSLDPGGLARLRRPRPMPNASERNAGRRARRQTNRRTRALARAPASPVRPPRRADAGGHVGGVEADSAQRSITSAARRTPLNFARMRRPSERDARRLRGAAAAAAASVSERELQIEPGAAFFRDGADALASRRSSAAGRTLRPFLHSQPTGRPFGDRVSWCSSTAALRHAATRATSPAPIRPQRFTPEQAEFTKAVPAAPAWPRPPAAALGPSSMTSTARPRYRRGPRFRQPRRP